MTKIKNLDVQDIQQQIDSTKDFINKTKENVEQVKQALNGVTTLHDGFAGNTADSIRSFYEEAHKPFLEFMESFLVQYEQALSTVSDQVLSFEPNESGFIRQEFLEGELTNKMQKAQDSLSATTDMINQQLNSVSDLASVSHVKDSAFLESIADAKKRITKTVDNMYEMDSNATSKLDKSEDDMQQMKTYMSKLRNAIDKNNISVDNFNITQFNSEFFSYHNEFKLMAKGRNALATGESAEITEQEFEKLFPYTKNEEHVSDGHFEWHGTYYTLKDGRIVREYTHEDGISYEFVDKIPDPRSAPPSGFDKFAKGTWNFFTEDFFTVFDSNATKGERLLALGMLTPWGKGAKVLKKGGEGISDFAKYIDDLGDSKSAVKSTSKTSKSVTDVKNARKIDSTTIRNYIRDVENRTGRKLPKNQTDKLKDALRNKEYKKMSPVETVKHRASFNKVRENIIKEWEEKTGQSWPVYNEDVISKKTGKVIRNKGDKYDAHHIIENTFGGEHEWWNIHPAKFPNEHQAGIHGAGSPASELFKGGKK
ncbi:ribonuclease YeeF family protein [Terribacillus saccharophilus]|uniref:ribonuclease YeeF family protein n=1 Tax=Terribacillus saccharophilus TaxID=361277 RepID=UPI002DD04455|nr:LXG domain-containing protein [Terribacillus saccharophilus]